MCKYCEEILDEGFDEFGLPFKKYTFHPYNNSFLFFYRNDWVLCDEDGEYLAIIEYCPWCGQDLYNDSDTICGEVKEECHSYAFQLTTFNANIRNVEITDLFYCNYKSIEECKKGMEELINESEAGDCAHVFKLVPVTTYKLTKRWEEC